MNDFSKILELKNITKKFPGNLALKNTNFKAISGEIHALLGANGAGKSTLMNVLGGNIRMDDGEILINNSEINIKNPRDAALSKIAFVHQELSILPTMSVAENIFINKFPKRNAIFIDKKKIKEESKIILNKLGCNFSPGSTCEFLSTGEQQMVEIGRALAEDPDIIIFDEPTSSLTNNEKEKLFDVINNLKKENKVIIYISHFLDEVFRISDKLSIMRNGENVLTGYTNEFQVNDIIKAMLGSVKKIDKTKKNKSDKKVLLDVNNLNLENVLKNINFKIYEGEILGICGLLGSGRTELFRALIGLDKINSGKIKLNLSNEFFEIKPKKLHNYVGYVTEDRRNEGLWLNMSIIKNISISFLDIIANALGFINKKLELSYVNNSISNIDIKYTNENQNVDTLSGGNQQKVVFTRWIASDPLLFFLDEPTRGLDVNAKIDVLKISTEIVKNKKSVLIISSEYEDLIKICDRLLIMKRGEIINEISEKITEDKILMEISS